MTICKYCGERIIFRRIDGDPKPIHINGGYCKGGSASRSSRPQLERADPSVGGMAKISSYVNPNAKCPVCNASVFYYQNDHGSRVFFNALGWPWEKHPCTDSKDSQNGKVYAANPDQMGEANPNLLGMVEYMVVKAEWEESVNGKSQRLLVALRRPPYGIRERLAAIFGASFLITIEVKTTEIEVASLNLDDFLNAPCFILPRLNTLGESVILTFISGRLKRMVQVRGFLFSRL